MLRFASIALIAALLPVAALACDGKGTSPRASQPATASPIPSAPASTAPRTAAPTAFAPLTAVPPTPRSSPSSDGGRIDGTVAPQGFGGTDPVTVKANPDPPRGQAALRDVRLGVHSEEGGWDRIVFEFAGDLPPGSVSYGASAVGCGSGMPISLPGGAVLSVRFSQTAAHTEAGQPTVAHSALAGAGRAILAARQTCDFEGEVAWALGVKDRQRFKVTLLDAPRRVVIDVKH